MVRLKRFAGIFWFMLACPLFSQDLSDLTLIAHYPLFSDNVDVTGKQDTMTLINTPFKEGGIYCNGVYAYGAEPGGCEAVTPFLNNLTFRKFAVSATIRMDSLYAGLHTQLVGGNFYRWMSVYDQGDTLLGFGYNREHPYKPGVWQTLTVTYDSASALMSCYLDSVLVDSYANEISTVDSADRVVGITDGGWGVTYKGYMKDLKIYSLPQALSPAERDSLALISLYNYTDGSNWTDNTNWRKGPIRDWFGVTMDSGRVRTLYLGDNNLAGEIPDAITALSKMSILYLQGNNLINTIPDSIHKMKSLVELRLERNRLDGAIPEAVTGMTQLINLNLSDNDLTGPIPENIGNLQNLEVLNLSGNGFEGPLPESLWSRKQLRILNLSDNKLTGRISETLGDLTEMEHLYLEANDFEGDIPYTIGNLTKLKNLYLSGNRFSDEIPSEMGNCVQLETLLLTSNALTGPIPASFSNLRQCRTMMCGNNLLTGAIPAGFVNLDSLEICEFGNNRLTGLPDLTGMPDRSSLNVINNFLTFEDIEPNIAYAGLNYSPQKNVGTAIDTFLNAGDTLSITTRVGGSANTYQWYRNNRMIAGAVDSVYGLTVNAATQGNYTCHVGNTIVPDLLLVSEPVSVQLIGFNATLTGDSLALAAIYNNTNGPAWKRRTNWLTGPLESWEGISINGGRVSELRLEQNNLSGPLPSEIAHLTGLRLLSLAGNALTDTLPAQMEHMVGLKHIYLNNNNLSGTIPAAIGMLPELERLNLSFNQFSGEIPPELGALNKLWGLELNGNALTGPIPPELGNLTRLQYCYLYGNDLDGMVPAEFGDLVHLEELHLHTNQLSGEFPQRITELRKLKQVFIQSNQFTGLPDLSAVASLTTLRTENNRLTFEDIIPNLEIEGFIYSPQDSIGIEMDTTIAEGDTVFMKVAYPDTAVQYQWYQNFTPIEGATDSGYTYIHSDATSLHRFECAITHPGVPELILHHRPMNVRIYRITALTGDSLALVALYRATDGANWTDNTNWLTGSVANWKGVTVEEDRVTRISLRKNNLTGTIPDEITLLYRLKELELHENQLRGQIPVKIGNLSNLVELNLSNNELTGMLPGELGNLSQLETLSLGANQYTGIMPESLCRLTNLRYLFLKSCGLNGSIPADIGNLTKLSTLYLDANQLEGEIPASIGNLANLTGLYLNANKLSGSIPASIGNLTKLNTLYLYANDLTGKIPPEIGKLTELTRLYLRTNKLSGAIPKEIGLLENLKLLYLNTNDLSGPVPPELADLQKLEKLGLNDNRLTELPNLASDTALVELYIHGNQFTFEDIEPNVGISRFEYSPQDSVGEVVDTTLNVGASAAFSVTVGGSANIYQWMKNGEILQGRVGNALTLPDIAPGDAGDYICRITNYKCPELTLYSRPIRVSVNENVSVEEAGNQIPKSYALYQNAPNPFNPSTGIRYDLPEAGLVRLTVYNASGQKIRSLVKTEQPAGAKSVIWNGRDDRGRKCASGIYIYRIEAGTYIASRKLMMID